MKKHLLTSTALVAAGAIAFTGTALAQEKAGKPTISLGGWTEQIIGISDNDHPEHYSGAGNGVDQQSDAEIHFNGAVTLDNGINIRTRIELEGNSSNGNETDDIDEHWMRISGSFGALWLGSADGAAQAMVTGYQGSWSTGVGQNLSFDVADWIETPTGHTASTVNRVSGGSDGEKISYFTPRFAGFQLGAAYVPNADDDQNNSPPSRTTDDHNGYQAGLNYVGKFGDFGIGAAVGYTNIQDSLGSGAEDNEMWGGGLRVDFGGFRVGVGYVGREDAAGVNGSTTEGEAYDFGARYTFGPNAVSLTYQHSEKEPTPNAANDDETDQAMLSFRRTLGPGVAWTLNGMWADYEGATAGNSDDNGGYALTTSIKVRF